MADISHAIFYTGALQTPQTNILRGQLAFLNQPGQEQGIFHLPCKKLLIVLSSWGGNTFEMRSLYGLLRSLSYSIEVHVTGVAKSAAIPFMLAADRRTAAPDTTFLLHPWTWGTDVNPSHTIDELRQLPMNLDDEIKWGKRVLVERTKLTPENVDDFGWFEEASFEDVDFALKYGLIHEAVERKIPPGIMTWNIA